MLCNNTDNVKMCIRSCYSSDLLWISFPSASRRAEPGALSLRTKPLSHCPQPCVFDQSLTKKLYLFGSELDWRMHSKWKGARIITHTDALQETSFQNIARAFFCPNNMISGLFAKLHTMQSATVPHMKHTAGELQFCWGSIPDYRIVLVFHWTVMETVDRNQLRGSSL